MGVAFLRLRNKTKAIENFNIATKLDPKQPEPFLNLAGLLLGESKYDDAIRLLKVVSVIEGPHQADVFVLWGRCLALKK